MFFTDSEIVTDSSAERLANASTGMRGRLLPRSAVQQPQYPTGSQQGEEAQVKNKNRFFHPYFPFKI